MKMLDRCTWSSSRLRAAMPIVHVTFRRLYHTSLIKLHFADNSMYRYCFLLFILHVCVPCYCLWFCVFMVCYNIIKLISILDIIAHNFHFYVAFCSPWWKIEISQLMMMMSWCLMSSDVIWHIRDKLWPMPKHGSIKSTYVRCMRV